jgi:hypothetical protein
MFDKMPFSANKEAFLELFAYGSLSIDVFPSPVLATKPMQLAALALLFKKEWIS